MGPVGAGPSRKAISPEWKTGRKRRQGHVGSVAQGELEDDGGLRPEDGRCEDVLWGRGKCRGGVGGVPPTTMVLPLEHQGS